MLVYVRVRVCACVRSQHNDQCTQSATPCQAKTKTKKKRKKMNVERALRCEMKTMNIHCGHRSAMVRALTRAPFGHGCHLHHVTHRHRWEHTPTCSLSKLVQSFSHSKACRKIVTRKPQNTQVYLRTGALALISNNTRTLSDRVTALEPCNDVPRASYGSVGSHRSELAQRHTNTLQAGSCSPDALGTFT